MFDEALENGTLYYTQEPVYRNTYSKVSLVTFESPYAFHVKMEEKAKQLEVCLEEELQEFVQNFSNSTRLKALNIAMPVMAPHKASTLAPIIYCRAEIVSIADRNVEVSFIDLGVVKSVPIDSLRMITKSLLRIPKFLYLCRLHNVLPINGGKWPPINWSTCLPEGEVQLNFINQNKDGVFLVQMDVNNRSFGVSLISDHGIAKSMDLNAIKTSSGPFPVYDYSAWENTKVPVFGVSVVSMQVAWFQLQTDTANAIIEATSNYISNITEAQMTENFSKNVGDPCLALFTEDNSWYRAQILEIRAPDTYKVLFVDFGNVELVKEDQITKIPDFLANVPVAATEVSILDVLGIQGKDDLTKLKQLVENKDLVASIENLHVNFGDKDRILISVWEEDGTSLSEHFPRSKEILEGEPLGFDVADEQFCNLMAGGSSEFYPGVEYQGVISYAECVKSVWLQLNDSEERAIAMGPELQRFYSNSNLKMDPDLIRKGVFCVAKQSCDSLWYRAIIKEVNPVAKIVSVLYIDYGNDEEVSLESLKPLTSYFAREKCLAIQAALDVIMKPKTDEDAVVNEILDFAEGRKLYVMLAHVNTINYASLKVDLCDILFSKGMVERTNFTSYQPQLLLQEMGAEN